MQEIFKQILQVFHVAGKSMQQLKTTKVTMEISLHSAKVKFGPERKIRGKSR